MYIAADTLSVFSLDKSLLLYFTMVGIKLQNSHIAFYMIICSDIIVIPLALIGLRLKFSLIRLWISGAIV